MLADGIANFFLLVVTDVIVTVAVKNHEDVIMADVFLPMWLIMAILWDGWWCCHCGRWNSHIFDMTDVIVIVEMELPHCEIINDVATVADGIATYVDSWCYCYYSDEARSVGLVKACVPA